MTREEIDQIVDKELGDLIGDKLEELSVRLPSNGAASSAVVETLLAAAVAVAVAGEHDRASFDRRVEAAWRSIQKLNAEADAPVTLEQ